MWILKRLLRALFRPARRRRATYKPVVRAVPQRTSSGATRGPIIEIVDVRPTRTVTGRCWVVDGDTIIIGQMSIRLAGIDAPELDQPYGLVAKSTLIRLCRGREITAVFKDELTYDREVATCFVDDGTDLAAEMVSLGLALDWRKFSGGKYRHLEPIDARQKLWRVDARQKGLYPPPSV